MYFFERLTVTNLFHLVTLYKSAFNIDVSIDFLTNKYNTKAFGADYVGYIAFTEDKQPAAYYGVFPIICVYEGSKILCAQSGDTMTHQDHRGKGLFVDLAKRTFDLAREVGIKFIFGFPNKNSYPGFVKKLNWQHREDLNLYSVKVFTLPFVKVVKRVSFLNVFYKPFMNLIFLFYNKSNSGFDNSLSYDASSYILHDKVFFDYKTYFKSFFFSVNGKFVWLKVDGKLWVGDIQNASEQEFFLIIKKLKRLAFFIGATEIHFHSHPKTNYDNYLGKIASVKSKSPIGYINLSDEFDCSKVKFQSGDFDMF